MINQGTRRLVKKVLDRGGAGNHEGENRTSSRRSGGQTKKSEEASWSRKSERLMALVRQVTSWLVDQGLGS